MRKLNTHLPKNRKTIGELLAEDSPEVSAVSGGRLAMKKDEIEILSRELPETLRERVKLPLVFLRRRELGAGTFTLLGDFYEEYAVSKILGEHVGSLEEFHRARGPGTVFYKPQVSELMRRFHSLITIGFGLTE